MATVAVVTESAPIERIGRVVLLDAAVESEARIGNVSRKSIGNTVSEGLGRQVCQHQALAMASETLAPGDPVGISHRDIGNRSRAIEMQTEPQVPVTLEVETPWVAVAQESQGTGEIGAVSKGRSGTKTGTASDVPRRVWEDLRIGIRDRDDRWRTVWTRAE